MKRILILSLLLLVGCEGYKQQPIPQWTVNLVRPDGEIHKSWIVSSKVKPVVELHWNGCVELCRHNGFCFESAGMVAPVGWLFDCEEFR